MQMFIVLVVAIPSILFLPSEMRHFGQSGFSVYQEDSEFCRDVPKEMWTAACCIFQTAKLVQRVCSQKLKCKEFNLNAIEERLT